MTGCANPCKPDVLRELQGPGLPLPASGGVGTSVLAFPRLRLSGRVERGALRKEEREKGAEGKRWGEGSEEQKSERGNRIKGSQ